MTVKVIGCFSHLAWVYPSRSLSPPPYPTPSPATRPLLPSPPSRCSEITHPLRTLFLTSLPWCLQSLHRKEFLLTSQILPPALTLSFHLLDETLWILFCSLSHFALKGLHGKLCLSPSVQFSRSVVSDSLRPHESQHARPPCPSPTPGVHSSSCPSSQ